MNSSHGLPDTDISSGYSFAMQGSKSLFKLRHSYFEIAGNVRRLLRLVRLHRKSEAIRLMIVKMMDYSDLLPSRMLPAPMYHSSKRDAFLAELVGEIFKAVSDTCRDQITWPFQENEILEISYSASQGDPEMHQHMTQAFVRGGVLHIRYFDDECTVWQRNPWRASTVTIAEIKINLWSSQLDTLQYVRYRGPRREKYDRTETLLRLNAALDKYSLSNDLDNHPITFAAFVGQNDSDVLCRFSASPLLKKTLISAQLRIVSAIMSENVAFVKAGVSHCHATFRAESATKLFKRRTCFWRNEVGHKQLRYRLLSSRMT